MDWPLIVGVVVAVGFIALLMWKREPAVARAAQGAQYLRDVRAELRKVTWPTWQDLKNMTVVIVIIVFVAGVVIGIMDWIFAKLLIDLLGRVFG